ncbi:MAG TPA: cytochrome P450 [Dehalococcoidia bacterium]|nr:cytochrome P450 [Dehalococcoidia bacterium]
MDFNPMSPEFRLDPYPTYAAMRRDAPVYRSAGYVVVTRYDDVVSVLRQPNLFSSSAIGMNVRGRPARTIINTDPPVHTRIRGVINRAFTPRMVADLEPMIRRVTARLLDRMCERGEGDIVRDLAVPLPVTVIAHLLGVDPDRQEDFKRWSTAVISETAGLPDDERARVERDTDEFQDYFDAAIAERRERPGGDDLISAIVRAQQEDEELLSADDVLAFTGLLLIAGNETTTNLIGNAVLALLAHPEQMARVREEPALVPNLVEEALRWDSPVQFLFRTATEDTEIAGEPIAAGTTIIPVYASANRDDARFPEGDRFDVTRNAQGHVAFGYGVHFCLGAPLARLEARVALEQALARLPGLRRAGDTPPERVPSLFLRGVQSLRVAFDRVDAATAR